ncbi:hypothetical protein PROFUN_11200 [Planoprotostelium fungivorum]|uniref:Ribose-phosphate pyrophosphokinase N-terminal domain-containing protein n=1 Tax=Planoprotostelium fungivorum TaxID=1890364 RepID=A0A2P6NAW1_9EUKA|nr:hypothetical protein PROFUN_11200 [Planoprotostelium fungivorum]
MSSNNRQIIFFNPEMKSLAESMQATHPDMFELGAISWQFFEDGFPNLFIQKVETIRGRDIVILLSFLRQDQMLAQLSVIYALPRYFVGSLKIILPYFPTGTMERVDEEGQIATAFTFARLLSRTPLTIKGPAKLVIYDIHALQTRFYFDDSVVPLLVSAIPMFLRILQEKHANEKIVIVFPDEGAWKRFKKNFDHSWETVCCIKVREGDKRVVKIKEGEEHLDKAHAFIVDDLVKSGGTLLECKGAITRAGATKVSAFVTHAVFPNRSYERFKEEDFSTFYTTDSCPETSQQLEGRAPFKVLPLAPSISDIVINYQ